MRDDRLDTDGYHGLTKNGLWVIVSNISMGFILLLTIVGSRVLGDAAFGQYIFLLAVTSVLSDVSVAGTTDYAGVLAAREPSRTGVVVANSLGLRVPFMLAFLVVSELATWLVMSGALLACLLMTGDWMIKSVIHLLRGVLRARGAFAPDARAATIERAAVLLCAGVGLFVSRSLLGFLAGFLVGRAAGLWACIWAYRAMGERFYLAFDFQEWGRLLHGGWPIGARGLFKIIVFRIDAIVLGTYRSAAEVGWYGAAYKLIEASFLFQETVGSAIQPSIARSYGLGFKARVSDIFGRGYKTLLIVGSLLAAGGFAYAGPVIDMTFGAEYRPATAALQVLVWAMLGVFASLSCLVLLDAVESQRTSVTPFVFAALAKVCLNVVLVPQFGFVGAAWITLLTELYLAAVLTWIAFRVGYRFPLIWIVGPLIACAVFVLISLALSRLGFPWIGFVCALVAFGIVLVRLHVFDDVDRTYASFVIDVIKKRSAST